MNFLTKRPAKNHPNPEFWSELRKSVLEDQHDQCATCPATSKDYQLELHHRHYNNFGAEDKNDVVILCKLCHDAITSRFRAVRDRAIIKHEPIKPVTTEDRITYEKPRF